MTINQFTDIHTVRDLRDLTQDEGHAGKKVPEVWLDALKSMPEVSARHEAPSTPLARGDELHALIPRTTLVINVRAALWEGLQASVKAFLAAKAASVLHLPEALAQGASAIDSINKLRKTVDRLAPRKGELCVYVTIVQARRFMQSNQGQGTLEMDFITSHVEYGTSCRETTCQFHNGSQCGIQPAQRDDVVQSLVARKVIMRAQILEGPTLWPN